MVAAVLRMEPDERKRKGLREFARWLRETMKRRRINQAQVARYAGVSENTVSGWLRGGSMPERDSLQKLATGLHESYTMLRDLVEGNLAAEDALIRRQLTDRMAQDMRNAVDEVLRRYGFEPQDEAS